jgi:hypothetical protein
MHTEFVREEEGILKIHEFEKHYITTCLKKEIERVEEDCKALEGPYPNLVDDVRKTYLYDLKTVLERVEAMPSTRW